MLQGENQPCVVFPRRRVYGAQMLIAGTAVARFDRALCVTRIFFQVVSDEINFTTREIISQEKRGKSTSTQHDLPLTKHINGALGLFKAGS